jgi:hypothetical protein
MLDLGLIGFTQPWLLAGLIALPALWLLLRITPPAPRRIAFPALLMLLRLESREETPARTPLWLLLLRLLIATLLILALAGPVFDPAPRLAGSGPVLVVVDDGWAAASRWERRVRSLQDILAQAERESRPVVLLGTAPGPDGIRLERSGAREALEALPGFAPRAWPVDRAAALRRLASEDLAGASVFWLSDGLAGSSEAASEAVALATALQRIGPLSVLADPPEERELLLLPPATTPEAFALAAVRGGPGPARTLDLRAVGPGGEVLARARLAFAEGARDAEGRLELPMELRNRIARLEVQPLQSAGGVVLFDERWRRRTVGLLGAHHAAASQPLLGDLYFIERALRPFAEIREGAVAELMTAPLSLMIMADVGQLGADERRRLEQWIDEGGVLLRFAGPRLAASADDFVPVPLRAGDRQLGGALSWSEPLPLAPFDPHGPFAGLVPHPEVRVQRQVLAEPGPGLSNAVLAQLADGTPLITGRQIGHGWLILVHTTANTSWTSLPLSGLFVDMLRRILAMAPGAGGRVEGQLEAKAVIDASGRLVPPPANLQPVTAAGFGELKAGPLHPPGLYGPPDAGGDEGGEAARVALNLQTAVPALRTLDPASLGGAPEAYRAAAEVDLAPWLLLAALLLALGDMLIALGFRGLLPPLRTATPALVLLLLPLAAHGQAPADEAHIQELIRETRLAYVHTGRADLDESSAAGLEGLGIVLSMRTSIETGEPVAVDVATDELALFPLLYWPVTPDQPDLDDVARERVARYLRDGGMILFDTRDAGVLLPGQSGGGPGEARLAQLLARIDLPPLVPVPEDHVLTRSFYLLHEFPGRFTGQPVWVEQASNGVNDGVSGVIIGANDWAGAWAVDRFGQSLFPVDPGGETQREMARRFGVNLVMYALTGNYKTDQVHVPALLERLGQ